MATQTTKVIYAEGAAAATPAAGTVATYAKADGLMYSKDDAGTETLMSGGAGGGSVATDAIWDAAGDLAVGSGANTAARLAKGAAGGSLAMLNGAVTWNAGTSMPGSPATGDRYWRTDLAREFYWDGTQWLTTQEFAVNIGPFSPASGLGSSGYSGQGPGPLGGLAWYLTTVAVGTRVLTTSNGSDFWTVDAYKMDAGSETSLGNFTTAADAADNRVTHSITVNATVANTVEWVGIFGTKTASPGNLFAAARFNYRLIGT